MPNEIIPYLEMCQREGVSLQRGMNFELQGNHSVILMSVRPNAPYADRFEDDGTTLIYEGHDLPRSQQNPNPKTLDQPSPSSMLDMGVEPLEPDTGVTGSESPVDAFLHLIAIPFPRLSFLSESLCIPDSFLEALPG